MSLRTGNPKTGSVQILEWTVKYMWPFRSRRNRLQQNLPDFPSSYHGLVEQYFQGYLHVMGMESGEARDQAQRLVKKAAEEVKSLGWHKQPPMYGDHILQLAKSNPDVKRDLDLRYFDGVTDDDIRWWHNMPAIERVLIQNFDESMSAAAYIAFRRQGLDSEEAARETFKCNIKYGTLVQSQDPDRPIPLELKRRIVEWQERERRDPESYKKRLADSSSFNALIRSEICAGRL